MLLEPRHRLDMLCYYVMHCSSVCNCYRVIRARWCGRYTTWSTTVHAGLDVALRIVETNVSDGDKGDGG
jgi:hypothetical protein